MQDNREKMILEHLEESNREANAESNTVFRLVLLIIGIGVFLVYGILRALGYIH